MLVETLLMEAADEVKDAVGTCFLEGLLGQASGGSFDFCKVAEFLGPQARCYCQEWNKFTGVETPGLEGATG